MEINFNHGTPRNFSWVVDGKICAMGFPGFKENIQFLLDNKIEYLLSLTAECQPPVTDFPDLKYFNCKVQDFTPPTLAQIDDCIQFMEEAIDKGKIVGLHCAHGKGRTGTVLACYFVKTYGMTSEQAVSQIRILRPGSIETSEQEQMVYAYENRTKCKQK